MLIFSHLSESFPASRWGSLPYCRQNNNYKRLKKPWRKYEDTKLFSKKITTGTHARPTSGILRRCRGWSETGHGSRQHKIRQQHAHLIRCLPRNIKCGLFEGRWWRGSRGKSKDIEGSSEDVLNRTSEKHSTPSLRSPSQPPEIPWAPALNP